MFIMVPCRGRYQNLPPSGDHTTLCDNRGSHNVQFGGTVHLRHEPLACSLQQPTLGYGTTVETRKEYPVETFVLNTAIRVLIEKMPDTVLTHIV